MRVFNQEKTLELYAYDLEKGCLQPEQLLVAHHPAVRGSSGTFHYEVLNTYSNGGKEVEKVWDILPVEPREAYDEYEDILVYVPYTDKELAALEIVRLKQKLNDTIDQAIAYMEGDLSAEEYQPIKVQRQAWRDKIRELEAV